MTISFFFLYSCAFLEFAFCFSLSFLHIVHVFDVSAQTFYFLIPHAFTLGPLILLFQSRIDISMPDAQVIMYKFPFFISYFCSYSPLGYIFFFFLDVPFTQVQSPGRQILRYRLECKRFFRVFSTPTK